MTQKQLIAVAALTASILTFTGMVQADSTKLVNSNNGHTYQRFDTAVTWDGAKTACANLSAHLATSSSQSENDWINSNLANGIAVWLGGTDADQEGTWTWITGETWSYTNWSAGEPNNTCGGENYLMMNYPGKSPGSWNDYGGPGCYSTSTLSYLCEWDTCDKDCPAPFVINEFWTTEYGTAAANVVLSPTNFLACYSPSYALCYYSGPDAAPTGSLPSLPCAVSTKDPKVADCRCYVEPASGSGSVLSFVDINSIRNTEAYIETIRACGLNGENCRNMVSVANEKNGKAMLKTAPVCGYLQAGANGITPMEPGSELISTFSFAKVKIYSKEQKDCSSSPAPYAGCMTASCTFERDSSGNRTGFANCKCPIYTGPYQIGQANANCDAGSGYVWSAAYSPNPIQLPIPLSPIKQ